MDEIRRLLREIAAITADAAELENIADIRRALGEARRRQYDVEFRVYRAFTQQGRDRARADGG